MAKILFCGAFPRNNDFSGSHASNVNILNYLSKSNLGQIQVLAPIFTGETAVKSDLPITFLKTKYFRGKSFGDLICKFSFKNEVVQWLKANNFKPDVIFIDANSYLANFLTDIPKILSLHGSAKYKGGFLNIFIHPYSTICGFLDERDERKALYDKDVKRVIINSNYSKNLLINDYRLPANIAKKIEFVPRGCDIKRFEVENVSKKDCRLTIFKKLNLSNNGNDCFLIFVGGFSKHKGQRVLISEMPNILKNSPNAKLILVGKDSGDMDYCKNTVEKLNLQNKVFILSGIADQELGKLLKGSDVYVSASLEGYGINQAEGMAIGLPLVALDIGAVKELFESGINGFLASDHKELVVRLVMLINNKNLRIQMGESAAKYANKNHNVEKLGEAVEKACLSILNNT